MRIASVPSRLSYDWLNVKTIVDVPIGIVVVPDGVTVVLGPLLVPLQIWLPRVTEFNWSDLSEPVA